MHAYQAYILFTAMQDSRTIEEFQQILNYQYE